MAAQGVTSRFDVEHDRASSESVKYGLRQRLYGSDAVDPMWVADMDFAMPQAVGEALRARLDHPILGYPMRSPSVGASFVDWTRRRHGWELDPRWLLFGPGVVPLLALAVQCWTQPGDAVVVQSPVYPPFLETVREQGRELRVNELRREGRGYRMDLDDLAAQLADGPALMLLCSPHNPVGRCWTAGELRAVIDLCEQHDVLLISDEIHGDLIRPGHVHTPAGSLSQGVVTFTSPGKTFNIAGVCPSVAVIPDATRRRELRRALRVLHLPHGDLLGSTAFEAAYTHGEPWLDELLGYLDDNLRLAEAFLTDRVPRLTAVATDATFLMWIDCRGLGLPPRELTRFFADEARVGVNDGSRFGLGGEGFVRLNVAVPRARLKAALGRIEEAAAGLG